MSNDKQDWASAFENSIACICIAIVLVVLICQMPSCCEGYYDWKVVQTKEVE